MASIQKQTMTRFTLRDVFWLTLAVGLALGWWVRERQLTAEVLRSAHIAREAEHRMQTVENLMLLAGAEVVNDTDGTGSYGLTIKFRQRPEPVGQP